jgi:hypothetical protein
MNWLLLALLLVPPEQPAVEVQRPGEAVPWALAWDAPSTCPTRAQVIAAVRGYLPMLEEPPADVARARLRINARVEVSEGEWHARLELSGVYGSTTRSFSAASCSELADAVALVFAVSLDPVVVAEGVAQARREADEPPTVAEPASEPEDPPPRAREPDELASEPDEPLPPRLQVFEPVEQSAGRPSVGARLFGGGGFGPTTAGYGALGLGVAVFDRRWRWVLEGGGWLPRTILTEELGGRFSGWWIGSRGCFVPALRRRPDSARALEFPLCGGVEAGQVLAVGLAPAVDTRRASQPWIAGSLGAGLSFAINERLALFVDAAALLPFVRGSFDIGDRAVQVLTPVGVRASLGVELRF